MALAYPNPVPNPATNLVNGIASLGSDDDTKPKKPALYRAGQAVGGIYDAAKSEATTAHNAVANAINAGVADTKLGVSNFVRGVQGQPALDALPATTPAPTGNAATSNIAALPQPLFNQDAAQLRFRGAAPLVPPDPPAVIAGGAAGGRLKSPAAAAGIDSGVVLPDGRKLNYGAMVNGVPTFSDGSGAPGGIPATMTKDDIAALGDRLSIVPSTAFTNAGAGVSADAAGLAPVSTAGQVATLVRNAQGPKFGITPEMLAQSDNNAVAMGDWRSAAGTAAHNLAVEAAAPSTYLQRSRALNDLGALRENTARAGQQAVDNAATLTRAGIAGQNALDAENLRGQYGLADTRERAAAEAALRKPDQVTLADGTVGLIQPNGTVTRAVGADGKPVQVPMTKNGALTEKDINDEAIKLLPQVLGTDPTTGMIKDPNAPGGYRMPTRDEIAAALPQARALLTGQANGTARAAPKVGDVVKGFRYKGGDPSLQTSWEKA